jgi:hypothetical protein
MSTAKVTFAELPEAGEVNTGEFFIIEDIVQTKKINFSNIIVGLDNITFANTLSGQSTDIISLSANVATLSAQEYLQTQNFTSTILSTVQSTTAVFVNQLYPVGSVICTIVNVNPQSTIVGTTWSAIASGLFIAGVGTAVDKNGTGVTIGVGATNKSIGEYTHTLSVAEMPAHVHAFVPISGIKKGGSGPYVSSALAPGTILTAITSSSTGGGLPHNNTPPVFGMYIWQRIV